MKISVLQEELLPKIQLASRFVATRAQLPVLANILLSAKASKLQISATDLIRSISLSSGAKVNQEGQITIPARILVEIVASLRPGKIELSEEKGHLKVEAQSFSAAIAGIPATEFPAVPSLVPENGILLERSVVRTLAKQVAFAAAVDDSRPVLTGVLLSLGQNLVAVATDGFRLSYKEVASSTHPKQQGKNDLLQVLVPAAALQELDHALGENDEISLAVLEKEGQIILGSGPVVITTRLIEGNFPDYEKVLPKSWSTQTTIDKNEFARAVKAASVFARESASVVKIQTNRENIIVSSESSQYGQEEATVEAKTEGEEVQVAYNFRYLTDFLNSVEEEMIVLQTEGPTAPGVFQGVKDPSYRHVIMPVRIQQ